MCPQSQRSSPGMFWDRNFPRFSKRNEIYTTGIIRYSVVRTRLKETAGMGEIRWGGMGRQSE